jgi:hypothetical protein
MQIYIIIDIIFFSSILRESLTMQTNDLPDSSQIYGQGSDSQAHVWHKVWKYFNELKVFNNPVSFPNCVYGSHNRDITSLTT